MLETARRVGKDTGFQSPFEDSFLSDEEIVRLRNNAVIARFQSPFEDSFLSDEHMLRMIDEVLE